MSIEGCLSCSGLFSLGRLDHDKQSLKGGGDRPAESLQGCRLVPPGDEEEIHRDGRGDDGQADGRLHGGDYHGDHCYEDGGQDVEDGEDQVDLGEMLMK